MPSTSAWIAAKFAAYGSPPLSRMRAAAMSCAKSGGRNAPPRASRHGTIPADAATSSVNTAVPATQFLMRVHQPRRASSHSWEARGGWTGYRLQLRKITPNRDERFRRLDIDPVGERREPLPCAFGLHGREPDVLGHGTVKFIQPRGVANGHRQLARQLLIAVDRFSSAID